MKKTFVAITVVMLVLMMLFVSCEGDGSGAPSGNVGDIKTKADLLAAMPGVMTPPSGGLKAPDESTVSLVKTVLKKLNADFNGEDFMGGSNLSMTSLLTFREPYASGYIVTTAKTLSQHESETTYNGIVRVDGKEIAFKNATFKENSLTESYSEGGVITVNNRRVKFEEAMSLLPKDENSFNEYWSLGVNAYRSGTCGIFSGRKLEDNIPEYSNGIIVLDIKADGHEVKLKYTCPSTATSFKYTSDCTLEYVAVDGSFYDTSKIK